MLSARRTVLPRAALRRRLSADLAAGRRSVDELLQSNDRLGEQQALLDATHASAVFSAQYGHRIAAAARLLKPRHKVVQAPPDRPAKALIPPTDTELRPREREQYADNAPPVWVRGEHHAQDD